MENVNEVKKINVTIVRTPKVGVNAEGQSFNYTEYSFEFKGKKIRFKISSYDKSLFEFLLSEK